MPAQKRRRTGRTATGSETGAKHTGYISARLFPPTPVPQNAHVTPPSKRCRPQAEAKFGPVDIHYGPRWTGIVQLRMSKSILPFQRRIPACTGEFLQSVGSSAKKELSPLQRTQFWDVPDGQRCTTAAHISWQFRFQSAGLPVRDRSNLLMDWLEATLTLLPDCAAVFTPSSGKLVTAESVRTSLAQGHGPVHCPLRQCAFFQHRRHGGGRPRRGYHRPVSQSNLPDCNTISTLWDPNFRGKSCLQPGFLSSGQSRSDSLRRYGRRHRPRHAAPCCRDIQWRMSV